MRLHKILTAVAVFLIAAGSASAGKKAGVTMPDQIVVAGKQLYLNGMGLREATWLGIDVYVAGLYVEHPTSDAATLIRSNETKQMVMKFVRDVGRKDILKAWNDGFANNATVPTSQIKAEIDQLNAWMPSFKEGDTLFFTYVPGQGVAVQINGERKGMIKGDDFARSLFSIWVGPKPPTKDLKKGLLGSHPVS